MYKIYVRDQYLNRVAEVDDFLSLEFILRFNQVGSWVLDIPAGTKAAQYITQPKTGIIVVKDGVTLLSGPVKVRNHKWNKDADTITVSGSDDMVYLLRNLAYPTDPPFTAKAYDVRTGKAETVLKQYVDYNIGENGRTDRRKLTVQTDTGIGNTVTGRARFHTLLELCSSLALSGGDLGFKVVQTNGQLQFQVYQPIDKTQSVFFSPQLGNLAEYDYTEEDPEANCTIAGGGGEGASRILLERIDSASIAEYDRYETFIDRRDTTDTTELIQAMDEELSTKARKTSLSITPIDLPNLSFGKHYNLGDKVTVKIGENTIKDVVREVKIQLTPNGETISPTVGTPESISRPMGGFFNKINKISKRLSNLERR